MCTALLPPGASPTAVKIHNNRGTLIPKDDFAPSDATSQVTPMQISCKAATKNLKVNGSNLGKSEIQRMYVAHYYIHTYPRL
jgi:hypothetical protein